VDPLSELRSVGESLGPAPTEMAAYLAKVSAAAYTVTDEDVAALKAAGISEDVIFEQTVAVAVAEGLRRLDAGLAALE
jgi:alkylhydroperoxidase family enzyme